jgi:hypothetical protein
LAVWWLKDAAETERNILNGPAGQNAVPEKQLRPIVQANLQIVPQYKMTPRLRNRGYARRVLGCDAKARVSSLDFGLRQACVGLWKGLAQMAAKMLVTPGVCWVVEMGNQLWTDEQGYARRVLGCVYIFIQIVALYPALWRKPGRSYRIISALS